MSLTLVVLLVLTYAPATLSANSKCSYCADYINKLECVEHCLRLLDQMPNAGTKRDFEVDKVKRIEVQLRLTPEQRKAFQLALNALPWEAPLMADGMLGPATRKRLQAWERINLPGVKQGFYAATGYLDKAKLSLVMKHVGIKKRQADRARNKHDLVAQKLLAPLVSRG